MTSVSDASNVPMAEPVEGTAQRAVEVMFATGDLSGSGYAIADDLVLTARDPQFDRQSFLVRRLDRRDWLESELVWADGAVGLLRTVEAFWTGVPARPVLLAEPPTSESVRCLILGYPRPTSARDRAQLAAIPGVFSPMPVGPGRVPVDVMRANLAKSATQGAVWPGLAGAPVLSEDGRSLLGVVVAEPAEFDGGRLHAAPIWQAMAAGLAEVVNPPVPKVAPEPETPAPPPPTDRRLNDQVEWQSDAPTTRDVLRRHALAQAIADRLLRRTAEDATSFLMLLDGRWGSGKTSVLRMTQNQLADNGWVVVTYDAWRQSRLGASWWTLLSALRQAVIASMSRPRGVLLRFQELWHQRVARTPAVLALSLVLAAAVGLFLLLRPERFDLSSLGTGVHSVAAVVTAVGTLWAGAVVSARFMLWQSRRSARFFEETAENPLNQVSEHIGWLVHKLARPLLVVIDDIDRCRAEQVVELLESVQTLMRDAPAPGGGPSHHPVAVIVAADAAWLHYAFEREYDGFAAAVAEPGKPLGHLFSDKIFQLVVTMPGLGEAGQAQFFASLLGADSAEPTVDMAATRDAARRIESSASEAEILQVLASVQPYVREQLGPQAVQALTRPEVERATEHALTRFATLLPLNPRSMKRFINDYSMARAVRTLEGDPVPVDALAQWTVMRIRWPTLAAYLAERPETVTDRPPLGTSAEPPPEDIARLLASAEVRRVLAFAKGTTLTPELIRRCHGIQLTALE